jgi:hypothetical protein
MQSNILRINVIYKSLLSLLVLTACGLALFIYYVDPFANYIAPYQIILIFTVTLFLAIMFVVLYLRTKILRNLIFVQEVYKLAFNSLVFATSFTFLLLLIYTNSLNFISFVIFSVSLASYCVFEFLD